MVNLVPTRGYVVATVVEVSLQLRHAKHLKVARRLRMSPLRGLLALKSVHFSCDIRWLGIKPSFAMHIVHVRFCDHLREDGVEVFCCPPTQLLGD